MRILVLAALSLTGILPAQHLEPDHHLVTVAIRDHAGLRRLLALDLDLAGSRSEAGGRVIEVIATDRDIETLSRAGFAPRVAIRNLEDHYEAELARHPRRHGATLTPPLGQGAMGGHYTLQEMEAHLDAFARNHPQICAAKVSIGKSVEGRDIWMVKISDNVASDENEPEVFFDALHHAREPLSMETTLLFMDELLDGYGKDPEATFLIDERELFFVTCVNPDGYEYNRQTRPGGGGTWRKNRRDNGNNVFGVDLNRNYATGFNAPNGGNSTNPGSSTYRGSAPFSEPEVAALEAFAKSRSFVSVNSCHCYGELLLEPWGYQGGSPPNKADYDRLGARLQAQHTMPRGPASQILYIAAGTALDHHHAAHGSYSWSPELGSSGEGGFWPAGANIERIARRHQPMFRAIARTAGASLEIRSITVTEVGGNRNGTIEPGESGAVVVRVDNEGVAPTAVAALVALRAVTPGIPVGTGSASLGVVAKFGTAANTGTPLTFTVPAGYRGPAVELAVEVTGDGKTTGEPLVIPLVPLRTVIADDMERDRGFTRGPNGTATLGLWERAAPQQTVNGGSTFQPGQDHSPTGTLCWVTDARAGTGAGSFDVDGGHTDLLSPVFDLAHLGTATIGFYRWYAVNAADDPFEVYVSRDAGTNFERVFADNNGTFAWSLFSHELRGPLTRRMQFRIRAQDVGASLVEALVDDFTIRGAAADGSLTVMSSGVRQSTVQFGFTGADGGASTLLVGFSLVPPIVVPGIEGALELDPATAILLSTQTIGSSGFAPLDLPIPDDPVLAGKTFYWQTLYRRGATVRFGNVQPLAVK